MIVTAPQFKYAGALGSPLAVFDPALRGAGQIPGLEADYNIFNTSGLIYDGSNRVQLVSDSSGNSNENCLVLNGVAGNYGSSPDSAAVSITGDIDLRARVALVDWTSAGSDTLVAKWTTVSDQRSYRLYMGTTGVLNLAISELGTAASVRLYTSTVSVPFADLALGAVRVTLDVDNGSGGSTATFYTSLDFVTWTQLGTPVVIASVVSIFNSTALVEVGSYITGLGALTTGLIYRAQIYNGINGTLAFDANFTLPAKLATSFTESSVNAATVTINTSGQYGARICGARDIVNMTAANQPIYTAGAVPILTFDGVNDSLKSAAFALEQPTTAYFLGSQVTWTLSDQFTDGNTPNSLIIYQQTTTPNVGLFAGSAVIGNNQLGLDIRAVLTAVFNGASSAIRMNLLTPITGNAGTNDANAFTVGSNSAGSAAWGNITITRALLYSGAHSAATQAKVISYLMSQGGVS